MGPTIANEEYHERRAARSGTGKSRRGVGCGRIDVFTRVLESELQDGMFCRWSVRVKRLLSIHPHRAQEERLQLRTAEAPAKINDELLFATGGLMERSRILNVGGRSRHCVSNKDYSLSALQQVCCPLTHDMG